MDLKLARTLPHCEDQAMKALKKLRDMRAKEEERHARALAKIREFEEGDVKTAQDNLSRAHAAVKEVRDRIPRDLIVAMEQAQTAFTKARRAREAEQAEINHMERMMQIRKDLTREDRARLRIEVIAPAQQRLNALVVEQEKAQTVFRVAEEAVETAFRELLRENSSDS